MTPSRYSPTIHASLLERVFDLPGTGMPALLAERILEMDFPEADAARVEELNEKANDGLLSADEELELEAYINIGNLLAVWQSKARQSLRNTG